PLGQQRGVMVGRLGDIPDCVGKGQGLAEIGERVCALQLQMAIAGVDTPVRDLTEQLLQFRPGKRRRAGTTCCAAGLGKVRHCGLLSPAWRPLREMNPLYPPGTPAVYWLLGG